jgi:hypothetical protein
MSRRAVVYLAWGERFLREAALSAASVPIAHLPRILLTDEASAGLITSASPFTDVRIVTLRERNTLAKSWLIDYLPSEFDSFLLLDTDTVVLDDVSFGFAKAERWGIALAMAPYFSLQDYRNFARIMRSCAIAPQGQMQYNTGVIFLARRDDVDTVLRKWKELGELNAGRWYVTSEDQPFFSLAMEMVDFNPYTLSPAFNCRGVGELISGTVRIWHSRFPVPSDINESERRIRSYFQGARISLRRSVMGPPE